MTTQTKGLIDVVRAIEAKYRNSEDSMEIAAKLDVLAEVLQALQVVLPKSGERCPECAGHGTVVLDYCGLHEYPEPCPRCALYGPSANRGRTTCPGCRGSGKLPESG